MRLSVRSFLQFFTASGIVVSVMFLVASSNRGDVALNTSYTPDSAVVAFDVHKIIVELFKADLVAALYNFPDKWNLTRVVANPGVWHCVYDIQKQTHCAQEIYRCLSGCYPVLQQKEFVDLFYNLANSQRLIEPMVEFIADLKSSGYAVYIASNIGYDVWAHLIEKYPVLGDLFDMTHVLCAHRKSTGGFVEKPYQEFYEQLRMRVDRNGDSGKRIVFFDDKQKNIDAAHENPDLSIIGYLCDKEKITENNAFYREKFGLNNRAVQQRA